jgi:ABC-type methionine transport system ATPase subunit
VPFERKVYLTYPSHLVNQPILHEFIRKFDVVVNILEANVTRQEGWLLVAVRGEEQVVNEGLEWMSAQGIEVKEWAKG